MRLQLGGERRQRRLGGMRANEHAIAARTIDFLDDEFGQMIEDIAQRLGFATAPGRHVFQYGFFVHVETHDVGHVRIDRLVVGDAGADGIGKGDIALGIGRHQPGHAEHRGRVERQRIDEFIIEAAVDDIDAFGPLDRPHEHHIVAHEKIGAFDEFDPQFVGEETVFVKGTIVAARRQQHAHRGVAAAPGARTDRRQRLQQHFGVGLDRRDLDLVEQFGNQLEHHLAVLEHVRHARRGAGIVFEDVEFIGPGADKIDAGDMRPHAAGGLAAVHLQAEAGVPQDQILGDDAGADDVARAIDIGKEQVERRHALPQALFEPLPFGACQDARHDVERDQPFGGIGVAIDRKGDADAAEKQFGLATPCRHEFGRAIVEPCLD